MLSVDKRLIWAFAGVLVAVALMLLNFWQVALVALVAAAGYVIAGTGIAERVRKFWQSRRS